MELIFKAGNNNVELGWASNNSCMLEGLIVDDREPEDTGEGDAWQLQYLPLGMVVRPLGMSSQDIGVVHTGFEAGTFIVTPQSEKKKFEIPEAVRLKCSLPPQAPSSFTFRRTGFRMLSGVATTDFFAQGQTIHGPVVVDLRIPPTGSVQLESVYVMLSRATTLHNVYLLAPLWKPGNATAMAKFMADARRRFTFSDDVRAEEEALRDRHIRTLEAHADLVKHLHYVDRSVDPHRCALCKTIL